MNDRLALFEANLDCAATAVASVLRGRPVGRHERDDMTQDALEALWKATGTWDGTGRFGGWAAAKARWAVIDGMRARYGRVHRQPAPVEWCDRADPAPGPDWVACARAELAEVGEWLGSLPSRSAAAVLACPEGETNGQVGARLGVSGSRVSQIRQEALRGLAA